MRRADPAWFDRMYNNRALVPEHAVHLARWAADSAQTRQAVACQLDLPFGAEPSSKLDIFPAQGVAQGRLAPVLVFLHGGYWRSLDKSDHSFIAPAFCQSGVCVVVPNYALCPGTSVPGITVQMTQALAWIWRHVAEYGGDPRRITVVGHSAGGHLAAMMLTCVWPVVGADLPGSVVRNALSISGLYDLEPLRHTPFLQADLRLTADQVRTASPAYLPPPAIVRGRGRLVSVAGAQESAEFLRQNALIRSQWGANVVPVCETLPGLNHFSVLEALVQPEHRLHRLARQLLD